MVFQAPSKFLFDIGANLTHSRYDNDLIEVLDRAFSAGINHMVVTGTSIDVSKRALTLATQYPNLLSCTAGVHPHDANSWNCDSAEIIRNLANHNKVVALGECGLDFNRNYSTPDEQLKCFEAQLELAAELKKPLFLHQRDAHDDFINLIKRYRSQLGNIVVHCFTGSENNLRQLVRHIPLDRILIETDAPYLTPQNIRPKPKSSRNEPAYLPYVLHKLSEVTGSDLTALSEALYTNSVKFFQLEDLLIRQ